MKFVVVVTGLAQYDWIPDSFGKPVVLNQLDSIITDDKLTQLVNVPVPMLLTEAGMIIDVKAWQL